MRLRPPTRGDAEAILAIMQACDIADVGVADCSLDDVLADWDTPDIDVQRDCFVAEEGGGGIVGYAVVDPRLADVYVDPRAEGRGVGGALRAAVEARQRERGERLCQLAFAGSRAIDHLRAAGYARIGASRRMRRALDGPPLLATAVRRFDVDADGAAVHALITTALGEIDDSASLSLDGWRANVAARSEPAFRLALDDDDGLVGAVVGERHEDGVGFVKQLAIAPRARGRGHGRALLLAVFDAFRGAGLAFAELSVAGTNDRATALYESVGMTAGFSQERWELR